MTVLPPLPAEPRFVAAGPYGLEVEVETAEYGLLRVTSGGMNAGVVSWVTGPEPSDSDERAAWTRMRTVFAMPLRGLLYDEMRKGGRIP